MFLKVLLTDLWSLRLKPLTKLSYPPEKLNRRQRIDLMTQVPSRVIVYLVCFPKDKDLRLPIKTFTFRRSGFPD